MKTAVILCVLASFVVYGEKPKSLRDTHAENSATASQNTDSAAPRSVVVVNQEAPTREKDNHADQPPNYLHRLFSPENIPTIALVIVGMAGIIVALVTLCYIARQATEMRRQRFEMAGQRRAMLQQLRAMQRQFGEMEKQTNALDRSVAIVMSKERARIEVKEPKEIKDLRADTPVVVKFEIELKGLTPPTIITSRCTAVLGESHTPPADPTFAMRIYDLKNLNLKTPVLEAQAWMWPTLTQSDIDDLKEGRKRIYLLGSISYRDVFYDVIPEERITKFRYCFGFSQSSLMRSLSVDDTGAWIRCGNAEDNLQT